MGRRTWYFSALLLAALPAESLAQTMRPPQSTPATGRGPELLSEPRPIPPLRPPSSAASPNEADITDGDGTDLLGPERSPIDLASALRLAGVNNPQILLARQRVVEAVALRQLAAAQILPSLHLGASLRQPQRQPAAVQTATSSRWTAERLLRRRANAIAAGTVSHPRRGPDGNVSEGIYGALDRQQVVAAPRLRQPGRRERRCCAAWP